MALINLTTDMTEPEERAAQNSNNNYLLKIAGGSPRGVYTSLSALNAAHPNGADGIYVVTSNGNWYYWSGTAWVSGGIYQATALADSSVTTVKIADSAVTAAKIASGAVTTSKIASDLLSLINSKIGTSLIGSGSNIDNLYGSSNYGVYYALNPSGTLPSGETQGILWVYDSGGGWARQVWLGNRCHTRLNASTSTANWGAWSNQHLLYDGYTGNLNNLNERKHCGFYSLSEYYPVAGRPAGEKGGILAVSYDSESSGVWQTFIGKKIWRRHYHSTAGTPYWGDWQTDTAIKTMTQAEYDALTEYDPDVVYIVGD